MSYKVGTTEPFQRSAKALFKRHRSFKEDLDKLISSLEENPFQGVEIAPKLRKIRMAITSKGRGKSGGARVITYTIAISESSGTVYLADVYDKNDYSTIDAGMLLRAIEELHLQHNEDAETPLT